MGHIEDLATNYERNIAVPWQRSVSGAQRVMLCIYNKEDERKLRAQLGEFQLRTTSAGHEWQQFDCTDLFSEWLSIDEYRDAYFEMPEDIAMKIEGEFKNHVTEQIRTFIEAADDNTVSALVGIASLYGFVHVSELIRSLEPDIRGRLVLFFPGGKEGSNYRLLDARDGWNYLATSITAHQTGGVA